MSLKRARKLENLLRDDPSLVQAIFECDLADLSRTMADNPDPAINVFKDGFELAQRAGRTQVLYALVDDVAVFFIHEDETRLVTTLEFASKGFQRSKGV